MLAKENIYPDTTLEDEGDEIPSSTCILQFEGKDAESTQVFGATEFIQETTVKKLNESKQRYKKLKQKLSTLSEQAQQCFCGKQLKDTASPNKSRLMKLSIEFEKIMKTQTKDYFALETLLRDTQKILDHRREHDLLILRHSRFIGAMSILLKKFPSLHKNEAAHSLPSIEAGLKILTVFSILSSNRNWLIASNQLPVLCSLLNSALTKEEFRLATSTLRVIRSILIDVHKGELESILITTLELVFRSQLLRKLKAMMELTIQSSPDLQFLVVSMQFIHLSVSVFCEREFDRATYEEGLFTYKVLLAHFQGLVQTLTYLLTQLIFQSEEEEDGSLVSSAVLREEELGKGTINTVLYIYKLLNLFLHLDCRAVQRWLGGCSTLLKATGFVLNYSKTNFKDSHEIQSLCSEIVMFLGNFGLQNIEHQEQIRSTGLLDSLCDHPIEYLMDPTLKTIFVSALCCAIYNNPLSIKDAFKDNSPQVVVGFISRQIAQSHKRKDQDQILEIGGQSQTIDQFGQQCLFQRFNGGVLLNTSQCQPISQRTMLTNVLLDRICGYLANHGGMIQGFKQALSTRIRVEGENSNYHPQFSLAIFYSIRLLPYGFFLRRCPYPCSALCIDFCGIFQPQSLL